MNVPRRVYPKSKGEAIAEYLRAHPGESLTPRQICDKFGLTMSAVPRHLASARRFIGLVREPSYRAAR